MVSWPRSAAASRCRQRAAGGPTSSVIWCSPAGSTVLMLRRVTSGEASMRSVPELASRPVRASLGDARAADDVELLAAAVGVFHQVRDDAVSGLRTVSASCVVVRTALAAPQSPLLAHAKTPGSHCGRRLRGCRQEAAAGCGLRNAARRGRSPQSG